MSTVKPNIFDGETSRPMTDVEYAQWQADNAETEAQAVAKEQDDTARAAARQNAIAKLTALGLTASEAAALFG